MTDQAPWVRELAAADHEEKPRWYQRAAEWTVSADGAVRRVRALMNTMTGKVRVVVDGNDVLEKRMWSFRSEWPFPLGRRNATLTAVSFPTASLLLTVEGAKSQSADGSPAKPGIATMPKWAWAFAIACGIIPIVSRGGALAALIGFGGATLCVNLSQRPGSTARNVALCAAVTVAAWALFVAMVVALGRVRGQ